MYNYQGRLRSRRARDPATAGASMFDILHLPEIIGPILQKLPAPDLLRFACASRGCRAAVSPSYVQLYINSKASLEAVQSLYRLGCLQQLRQAHLKASVSNSTTSSHLALLEVSPRLQDLILVCDYQFQPECVCRTDPYIRMWGGTYDLFDLAWAMPIRMHRTLMYYRDACECCGCKCGCEFIQHSDDGNLLHPDSPTSTMTRCTCLDRVWSWQPGQQPGIRFF